MGLSNGMGAGELTLGMTPCVGCSFFFCSPCAPLVARRFRRAAGTWMPRASRPATRPRSRVKAPSSNSRATTTGASKAPKAPAQEPPVPRSGMGSNGGRWRGLLELEPFAHITQQSLQTLDRLG